MSSDSVTLSSNRDSTVDWLIDGAPGAGTPVAILSGLCDRQVAAGVNIARCALFVETLHPMVIGRDIVYSAHFGRYLNTAGEFLGDFTVKGFSKPVSIYAVPDTPSTGASE